MIKRGAELAGRVTVITGAAIGIGRAAAEALAGEGAAVVIADIDAQAGAAAARALAEGGASALFVHTDVARMTDMEAMAAATVKTFGGIDILVNNAARAIGGVVDEIDEAT